MFSLIKANLTTAGVSSSRARVLSLLRPHATVMDFGLASVLHHAARGQGALHCICPPAPNATTTAKTTSATSVSGNGHLSGCPLADLAHSHFEPAAVDHCLSTETKKTKANCAFELAAAAALRPRSGTAAAAAAAPRPGADPALRFSPADTGNSSGTATGTVIIAKLPMPQRTALRRAVSTASSIAPLRERFGSERAAAAEAEARARAEAAAELIGVTVGALARAAGLPGGFAGLGAYEDEQDNNKNNARLTTATTDDASAHGNETAPISDCEFDRIDVMYRSQARVLLTGSGT